jgi:cobalt transporter subunit CbtA
MAAFRRLFFAALIAGLAAGVAASAVQAARLWPLIAAAEVFEAAAPHGHDHGAAEPAWSPEGRLRQALTVLFNIVVGLGFGLILNALARLDSLRSGRAFTVGHGVIWGAAGFAAFGLAPALGLPPELPGMASGELLARQIWWVATAICTLGGIFLVARAAGPWRGAGIVLIVLPHLIGAPAADGHGNLPGEMGAAFAAASLVASAVFWIVLGSVSGWAQQRFAPAG